MRSLISSNFDQDFMILGFLASTEPTILAIALEPISIVPEEKIERSLYPSQRDYADNNQSLPSSRSFFKSNSKSSTS
ncbi:MAG: hypothetical protein V7K25_03055 [Nostoc sp.]|uniref:hypothetical protein n=1 Tax=Nostoc sp. TaxID=1180 RepID=UPI002FF73378